MLFLPTGICKLSISGSQIILFKLYLPISRCDITDYSTSSPKSNKLLFGLSFTITELYALPKFKLYLLYNLFYFFILAFVYLQPFILDYSLLFIFKIEFIQNIGGSYGSLSESNYIKSGHFYSSSVLTSSLLEKLSFLTPFTGILLL